MQQQQSNVGGGGTTPNRGCNIAVVPGPVPITQVTIGMTLLYCRCVWQHEELEQCTREGEANICDYSYSYNHRYMNITGLETCLWCHQLPYIWHWAADALISEAHFALTMAVNGRLCVPTGKISGTLWSSMAVSMMRCSLSYCLH